MDHPAMPGRKLILILLLLMLSCLAVAAPGANAASKPRLSRTQIVKLQKRLKALKYYTGAAKGIYNLNTRRGVRNFQIAAGIKIDGIAGSQTLKALNRPGAPKYVAYKALYTQSTGTAVRKLQTRLNALGYYNNVIDGAYNAATKAAVKAFQKKMKLTVTGKATDLTQRYLYSPHAKKIAVPKAAPTPAPTAEATDDPGDLSTDDPSVGETLGDGPIIDDTLVVETPAVQTPAPSTPVPYIKLTKGQKNAQVKALQTRLKSLKYYTKTVNSTYDTDTVTSVKAFNGMVGLTGNGTIASVAMQEKLYSADAPKMPPKPSKPDPANAKPVKVPGTPLKPEVTQVVSLDWFNTPSMFDRKSGRFSSGSVAIVTDVKTGYTWRMRRCNDAGTFHADAEPLTAFDTWQMYCAYGKKKFDYVRHPLWVTVDGITVAASMYGVPHGGKQDVWGNNYGGVACIHFLNSKTHASERVDPDHKNAIKQALKADIAAVMKKVRAQKPVT